LLLRNEENGIFQVGRGIYLYDSTAKKEEYQLVEKVQKIMDDAFEKVRSKLTLEVVDYLTEEDIEAILKTNEVLKLKERVDEILNVKS
jgi:predicted transcriptional regulator